MNLKQKIHTARFKELDKAQDQFINARITTPQTYDQIKNKGQATILKIASKGIVEKLLKRCEYYKAIITRKTETIKSKNELIGLIAARLQHHEPELFNTDFKDLAEQVEQAKSEEVKTGLNENGEPELTAEEKKAVEKENKELDQDIERAENEVEREPDPEPEPDREPGIEKCEACGQEYEEGDEHECPEKEDNDDIIYCGGPDDDEPEEDENEDADDQQEDEIEE